MLRIADALVDPLNVLVMGLVEPAG